MIVFIIFNKVPISEMQQFKKSSKTLDWEEEIVWISPWSLYQSAGNVSKVSQNRFYFLQYFFSAAIISMILQKFATVVCTFVR